MNGERGSTIHAERVADCPFAIAHDYAEEFMRGAESGGEQSFVSAGILRRRVSVRFGLRSDSDDSGRTHDEIRLGWSARTAALPDFVGTLRMRIEGVRTRLLLDGGYRPPGGALGALFDRFVGRRIAAATADALLTRIADDLAAREAAWRSKVT